MFDETQYRLEDVDFRQVNRVIDYVREFHNENKKIYASSCSGTEKHNVYVLLCDRLEYNIMTEKINTSTMYHLIRMVEAPEMRSIKNTLFQFLFKSANRSFSELVRTNLEPITYLSPGGTDLYLYGYGFKKNVRN